MSSRSRNCAARYSRTASATLPRGTKIGLAVAAALAGAALPQGAAFGADAAADATSTSSSGLQEVVVTARKREENLQDVPISIDVFTKKDLQNLAINSFDDFAQKTPSVSFISVGPGTQVFVMRGVSDGSDPNYANTSATGFFVDDMSMSDSGSQPDLLLYDIEQHRGPQWSAGHHLWCGLDVGRHPLHHCQARRECLQCRRRPRCRPHSGPPGNWLYEGFLNAPVIPRDTRASASRRSATRTAASSTTNSRRAPGSTVRSPTTRQWARNDYNREHRQGRPGHAQGRVSDKWSATLMYGYQRQQTTGGVGRGSDAAGTHRGALRTGIPPVSRRTTSISTSTATSASATSFSRAPYWSQPTRQ